MDTKKLIIWIIAILVLLGIIYLVANLISNSEEDDNSGDSFVCDVDSYNCNDFQVQTEAQEVFDECGGVDNDIHRLDADGNGIACETLP